MSLHDGSRWTARELADRWTYAAEHHALDPIETFTYAALDSYANGAPECWASQATLCRRVRCSRSKLNAALRTLEDVGLIERVRGAGAKGNGGTTTLYCIADPDCESSNVGSTPHGLPHGGHKGLGVKDLLTADQQEKEPKNEDLVSASRTTARRPTHDANSAKREVTPISKTDQRGPLTAQEQRRAERQKRGGKVGPEKPVGLGKPPSHSDQPAGRRQTAAERNSERHEANIAAALAGARRAQERKERKGDA